MSSKAANHLFYLVAGLFALLATMPPEISSLLGALVPGKYKPYVAAIPLIAMWIKGHQNLFMEPPAK